MKKNIIFLAVCVFLVFFFTSCGFRLSFNKNTAEEYLKRDNKEIELIVNYLAELEKQYLIINKSSMGYFGDIPNKVVIEDPDVNQAVHRLLDRGYSGIIKGDNTIEFIMWQTLTSEIKGVAISIDSGKVPELGPYVIESEQIEGTQWYFYYDDYNKSRNHKGLAG